MHAKSSLFLLALSMTLAAWGQRQPSSLLPGQWLKTAELTNESRWGNTTPAQWGALNSWPVPQWTPAGPPTLIDLPAKAQQQATIFTVYHPAAGTGEQAIWTWERAGQSQWILTDQRLADLSAASYLNFAPKPEQPRLSTYRHQYGPGETASGRLLLGATPHDRKLPISSWTGLIAECLIYDHILPAEAQQQVESYLALKYGLSLRRDTVGVDYLHSSGTIVWNHQLLPHFHHRLTGIGHDAHWDWSQRQSASSEGGSLLQISAGKALSENAALPDSLSQDFTLIIGDNDAPLVWEKLNEQYDILQRQWLVQSWQTPAKLHTQLRLEAARWEGPHSPAARYWLAIDRSGQGVFDPASAEYYPLTTRADDRRITFTDLAWDTDNSGSDRFALLREQLLEPPSQDPPNKLVAWAYPNPITAGENIHWQLWLPQAEAVQLQLVAANGQVLTQANWPADTYLHHQLTAPKSGVYWLHFRTATQETTLKLIVQ